MPKSSIATWIPSVLSSTQSLGGGLDVAHEGGLGHLDDQRGGLEPAELESVPHVLDEVVPVELEPGDVDRDAEIVAERAPAGDLRARFAQHPASDIDDLPGRLEQRDELVRLDLAERGVLPAQQRLDADQREVVEAVDRLVVQHELVLFERRAQVELELVAVLDVGAHLRVEHRVAVLAGGLGLVQRHVRVAQQIVGVLAVPDGDAHAGRDQHRRAANRRARTVGG